MAFEKILTHTGDREQDSGVVLLVALGSCVCPVVRTGGAVRPLADGAPRLRSINRKRCCHEEDR